jgi:hypothetical protein
MNPTDQSPKTAQPEVNPKNQGQDPRNQDQNLDHQEHQEHKKENEVLHPSMDLTAQKTNQPTQKPSTDRPDQKPNVPTQKPSTDRPDQKEQKTGYPSQK